MLTYDYNILCIKQIILDPAIDIPEHQRPFIWDIKRQEKLIDTIMCGLPMPNLLFSEEYMVRKTNFPAEIIKWLEDGQQRFHTIKSFFENKTVWNGIFYKDFNEDQRLHFMTYKMCIIKYSNATQEERIKIFDNFQNGVALTPGQRFHAQKNTLLVTYAIERFMTKEKHFYNRMSNIFGEHNCIKDTKSKSYLKNIMAVAGGVAHGANFITTSYDILGPILNKTFNEVEADKYVDQLLSIFEKVDQLVTISKKSKKKQWDTGYITGYILATLFVFNDDINRWTDIWITYMKDIHEGKQTIDLLHYNKPGSRNWTLNRWKTGYNNLINPPNEFVNTCSTEESDTDEDIESL